MDTTGLKKFAQGARRQLLAQVAARLEQVLRSDSVEIREKAKVVEKLKAEIDAHGKPAVVDKVAYTWFNRFCALRFMDANHYTRLGAVSPIEGGTQPEVLLEAKQGHIDDDLARLVNRQVVFDLLSGKRPASDGQQEAYRLLLVGVCNSYNTVMPFLFEEIEDYTELLMPLDLLSENSVLHDLREALTPEACEDVEVIGWLYQYYISERKDEVFAALKQNQKIEAEDIPAATQLFTPHWIVRYLVENSLGRLWLLNHPHSKLREKMAYYIAPAQSETDFLWIASPEELRMLDPAGGSGHMLTYGFDLLYAIYEEEGYAPADIPRLILEKNLFGLEIDPRAGALMAFALTMKARAKDRRWFSRRVLPNVCVLENVSFTDAELKDYTKAVGRDLFTEPLLETLRQFEQAEHFGSLIRPILTDAGFVSSVLAEKNFGGDLFLYGLHERVLKVLRFAEFLAPRYHVVVANPPYMGIGGINSELSDFAKEAYPNSRSDLCAMFIERNFALALVYGSVGMITMHSWMFLSSYETMRKDILINKTILSMAHLGPRAFDSIGGEVVSTTAFVIKNSYDSIDGIYIRLVGGDSESEKDALLKSILAGLTDRRYMCKLSSKRFHRIPGSLVAYWVSDNFTDAFEKGNQLGELIPIKSGMSTTDNNRFLRYWMEVPFSRIGFGFSDLNSAKNSARKWFPFKKGGEFRKWYGNNDIVLNWYNDGDEIKKAVTNNPSDPNTTHWSRRIFGVEFFFKPGITWTKISSSRFSCRIHGKGYIFSDASNGAFPAENESFYLAFLNSRVADSYLKVLSPTLNFKAGDISKIPVLAFPQAKIKEIESYSEKLTDLSRHDWNSIEISWDFACHPLMENVRFNHTLESTYLALRNNWRSIVAEMKSLEEANNRFFIESYSLQSELTPDVSLEEITLICNPYYRYSGYRDQEELEALLRADTMKEFISYAVGCMFGRYSLDKPGLVLANQGETLKDYLKQVPKPTFMPDEDNVIPVLEGEWFNDDIAERFKRFLRVTFGEEHCDENLAFIEEAIGRDVRSYFVKEFYKDHVQTYKKRPIYWLFSSPKGSFNALIYMHRYQPDTVSIVLNGYLREYVKKLSAHKAQLERTSVSGSASQSQKTKALKEIAQVNKVLAELKEYEDDVLYPLATEQVKIDLDDGVKVNYPKFGNALAKIVGL